MTLKTHKPTGRPSWPILLLAGGEKCGKSYAAAAFSASDLIERTFWIQIGEGTVEEYGRMPGARYEVVEHDGSYPSMLEQLEEIVKLPRTRSGKPHAIVVDSMSKLWELLCDEQETIAVQRKKTVVTMDQWNKAKRRWNKFYDTLRRSFGPVILTARYEQVAVVVDGKPVEGKSQWKIKAEKNLPYEVDGIVEIPKPRQFYLNGVRSLVFDIPPGGHLPMPDFTVDGFLRQLGLGPGVAGARTYVAPKEDVAGAEDGSLPGDVTSEEILGGDLWPAKASTAPPVAEEPNARTNLAEDADLDPRDPRSPAADEYPEPDTLGPMFPQTAGRSRSNPT